MPPRLYSGTLSKTCSSLQSPSSGCWCQLPNARPFSSTQAPAMVHHPKRSRLRRDMLRWMDTVGKNFKDPLPGSTNYLGAYNQKGQLLRAIDRKGNKDSEEDEGGESEMNTEGEKPMPKEREPDLVPFPLNKQFRSQSVLADDMKDAIYQAITKGGLTVREASVKYNVDMRRIGAVVRLKAIEEQWEEQSFILLTPGKDKPLATVYHRAVLSMLPTTTRQSKKPHEDINDLPVHQATLPQLFYPTSESRRFTREDAGRVFDRTLLPADKRIPHPEMIESAKGSAEGLPQDNDSRRAAIQEKYREQDNKQRELVGLPQKTREANTTKVQMGRWEFRIEDVKVDETNTGRFTKGIGKRYGVPHQDRKKGMIKIPTRVEH